MVPSPACSNGTPVTPVTPKSPSNDLLRPVTEAQRAEIDSYVNDFHKRIQGLPREAAKRRKSKLIRRSVWEKATVGSRTLKATMTPGGTTRILVERDDGWDDDDDLEFDDDDSDDENYE